MLRGKLWLRGKALHHNGKVKGSASFCFEQFNNVKNQILNQSYLNDLVFNDMLQRTFGRCKGKNMKLLRFKWNGWFINLLLKLPSSRQNLVKSLYPYTPDICQIEFIVEWRKESASLKKYFVKYLNCKVNRIYAACYFIKKKIQRIAKLFMKQLLLKWSSYCNNEDCVIYLETFPIFLIFLCLVNRCRWMRSEALQERQAKLTYVFLALCLEWVFTYFITLDCSKFLEFLE